jgi:hypothetical protein
MAALRARTAVLLMKTAELSVRIKTAELSVRVRVRADEDGGDVIDPIAVAFFVFPV